MAAGAALSLLAGCTSAPSPSASDAARAVPSLAGSSSASAVVSTSLGTKPAAPPLTGATGRGTATPSQSDAATPGLPGGGSTIFGGKLYVALYGFPGSRALGVLGEQGTAASIKRAKARAATYRKHTSRTVVPAVEIIATVASKGAGADGNYSREAPISRLRPLVEAAGRAGVYVVLDLQPGRSSFLTQAKRYRSLLLLPHVGLALDPEWRLKPGQRHLRQIGSVSVAEVNATADWLAALTRDHGLPQKMLLLHQFKANMIVGRSKLDMSHKELAPVVQMDGQGGQPAKRATYRAIQRGAPKGLLFGWKNFYDEDHPMLSAKGTMKLRPRPVWVSYQ